MKLIDLLSVISDNVSVVIWKEEAPVAIYDGRDSISEEYNEAEVKEVWASGDATRTCFSVAI